MPFASLSRPPIGAAILKSLATEDGHECRVFSYNTLLARCIGRDDYNAIIGSAKDDRDEISYDAFFGEWIFSQKLFPDETDDLEKYAEWVEAEGLVGKRASLARLQSVTSRELDSFLSDCVADVLSFNPSIVGFSCTFQQTVPSLLLAQLLKNLRPELKVVFGGASMAGAMGRRMIQTFSQIDAVCTGEGEVSFQAFLRELSSPSEKPIPGIVYRTPAALVDGGDMQPVEDLDRFPTPDFQDFFEFANDEERKHLRLQYEATRGCWWGEKHHCTFCGQNASGMKYRAKSPERVAHDLVALSKRFGTRTVEFCDNILDMGYFKTLLPLLKRRWPPLHLFFEIKSNLTRAQVRLLRDAGVFEVQPGIESFSSSVLSLMRKGVSGTQNIALLKWCKLYGIDAHWNILGGFPGENPGEYKQMQAIVPAISHLFPPSAVGALRIDRFSPYHARPKEFGILGLQAFAGYSMIFPGRSAEFLNDIAYHFEIEGLDRSKGLDYMKGLEGECEEWRVHFTSKCNLRLLGDGGDFEVDDSRALLKPSKSSVSIQVVRAITEADSPCRPDSLRARYGAEIIEELLERRWLIEEGGWVISPVLVDDRLIERFGRRVIEVF